MRIERCLNGHFYDGEKNDNCPYCDRSLVLNAIPERFQKLGDITFLGTGSTSQVFKISGEQVYALKIVQCGSSESKYQNALYELKIMEQLNREPYTVHLCDYEVIDTENIRTIYMLEEYHRTMSDYLSGNNFYVAELLQIVTGVCDALIACIESGVLHLDVQPKNIFIDNQSRILLGDFSHSLYISDLKSNQISRGTLAFMAPEVYQKGYCSERSDLYSLGLILFSLFNNKVLPFMDSDTEEVSIYKRLAGAHFPKIPLKSLELENEINRIIGKACAYDLRCRYDSLVDFKNDLCRLYELVVSESEKNFVIYAKEGVLHKRILPVIYVLQTSGSMSGQSIGELNNIVHDSLDIIRQQALHSDIDIRVSTLMFGNQAKWQVLNAHADKYAPEFSASGLSNLGAALLELNRKLTRNDVLLVEGCYLPIVIYVTNGLFVDDFESAVSELKRNQWYIRSRKVCFLTGDEYNIKNLTMLTGSAESILRGNDIDSFSRLIRFVSVSASCIGNAFDADPVATSVAASFSADSVVVSEATVFDADPIATPAALSDLDQSDDDWGTTTAEDIIAVRRRALAEALRARDMLRVESDGSISHHSRENDKIDDVNNAGECVIVPDGKLAGGNVRRCRVCDNPIERNDNYCPYCGSKVVVDRSDVDISKVEFSAIAPKQLIRGDYSIIHVIMYENTSRHIVESLIREMGETAQESRSGIHIINEGSLIKIVLSSADITIDENVETGVWQGDHLNFSFAIFLPEHFKKRQLLFTASVFVNDVIACKLKFIVKCSAFLNQKIAVSRQDIFSAFVSYASQDRNRVAAIIQGMKKARPDMDVFFDVESLRSGDDWERALYREIDKRDILFLCWSHFARDSKWVDAEWRYALKQKGVEYIEPIPIESPDDCPPPTELNHKHFNDKLLFIINASKGMQQKQTGVHSQAIETDMQDEWW